MGTGAVSRKGQFLVYALAVVASTLPAGASSTTQQFLDLDVDYGRDRAVRRFYAGFGVSPAYVRVKDFMLENAAGDTRAVVPYRGGVGVTGLQVEGFDWDASWDNPQFSAASKWPTVGASFGWKREYVRFELELERGQFSLHGNAGTQGAGPVLLAKKLAYSVAKEQDLSVLTGQLAGVEYGRLLIALRDNAEMRGALEKAGSGLQQAADRPWDDLCAPRGPVGGDGEGLSPCGAVATVNSGSAQRFWHPEVLARGIIAASAESRAAAASSFARVVEGAEVVKLGSLNAKSAMVNACYDINPETEALAPYVCAGVGGSAVSMGEGPATYRAAYRLKLGLGLQMVPGAFISVGTFFHNTVGRFRYGDIPVQRVSGGAVSVGAANSTRARSSFKLSSFGLEMGTRLIF
ncbi:MAG: P44/Msp2 family outer membrane protein [Anaplasma sp.]